MRPAKERIRNSAAIKMIAKYKRNTGLTSKELGFHLGVTGDTIRTWISQDRFPTIQAWDLFCELVKMRASVSDEKEKLAMVPACAIHGVDCKHKCKPDKPARAKKPTWKITPPPCGVCKGKMIDVAEKKSRTHLWCDTCKEFKKVEMETITRYKY